jgi:hypothetical protein
MTIVVTVRVNDGMVMASDSATTFFDQEGRAVKVYNNANKLFNLVKVWPIGAMTYGNGNIGSESISTLSKDLRAALDPVSGTDLALVLDQNSYTVLEVAERAKRFLFARYREAYPEGVPGYFMGYRVCGYSAGGTLPEGYEVGINGNEAFGPNAMYSNDSFGPRWAGETEAIDRLILGVGSKFAEALEQLGVEHDAAENVRGEVVSKLCVPLFLPAMPIQDAIDLARFLAETAAKFTHFGLRAATVGGPIEVATITKHEGFKWVTRKHFYEQHFNH